jgi:hypothetical protein
MPRFGEFVIYYATIGGYPLSPILNPSSRIPHPQSRIIANRQSWRDATIRGIRDLLRDDSGISFIPNPESLISNLVPNRESSRIANRGGDATIREFAIQIRDDSGFTIRDSGLEIRD